MNIECRYWSFNRKQRHVMARFHLEKPRHDHEFSLPLDDHAGKHMDLARSIHVCASGPRPYRHFEMEDGLWHCLGYYKTARTHGDKLLVAFVTYNPVPKPRTIDDEWW